mgnify:CR=1 FL=1
MELYRTCDVLVVPSHSEEMPTVILEAMASGLAVIATDVDAVSLFVDGENGWLIEPRGPAKLKNALVEATKADLRLMKRISQERVAERLWASVTARFVSELTEYLGKVNRSSNA